MRVRFHGAVRISVAFLSEPECVVFFHSRHLFLSVTFFHYNQAFLFSHEKKNIHRRHCTFFPIYSEYSTLGGEDTTGPLSGGIVINIINTH
mmetsp:Transcript_50811/g.99361  ORF Transcript_50811/g.99361 Transcript_50811/m.99361 type:complete len:91 (+) Transcript_50811:1366-1638(+)